jgi:DNA-binding Lrp family transcriptional regulator
MYSLDELDHRIVLLFANEPRIGVLEASRRLGVARGTVQARLDRLEAAGVITGWAPSLDPVALGFPVSAFATLEIAQGEGADGVGHAPVAAHLRTIPEVLEAHTITGASDMMLRLVARSNADLQRVIDLVVAHPNVARASTVIVLASEIPSRVLPLVESTRRE